MGFTRYEDMDLPRRPYRIDRDTRRPDGVIKFETHTESIRRDAKSVRLMAETIRQYPDRYGIEALDLMHRLERGVETLETPLTLASNLFRRELRLRIGGHLWPLAEDETLAPTVTASFRALGMWVEADKLLAVNPRLLMRRLIADLARLGFNRMNGYLFVQLHAEFDAHRGGWDIHYHLVGGGEMATELDRLRSIRRFKAGRVEAHELLMRESPRVVISREPLTNLPDPLLYFGFQGWVPQRLTYLAPDGKLDRHGRTRIPEPWHTDWLIWMDRYQVSDLVFCVGMRPTKTGFQLISQ